jgi:ATP-binding cassette subfamily B protein
MTPDRACGKGAKIRRSSALVILMHIQELTARARLRGRLLARAFRLVWASAPGWTTASLVLVAAQGLLPLATLYLIKLLVDALAAAFHGVLSPQSGAGAAASAAGAPASASPVLWILAAAGAVAVLEVVARSLAAYVAEAQTETVTDHLSDVIHEKSAALDLSYFEDPHYHDMLHRAQEEAGWRPTYLVNSMLQAAQASLSLVALASLLLSLNWAVGLVLFLASAPAAALRVHYAGQLYLWRRKTTADARLTWYLHALLTDAHYAKELRMLDLGAVLTRRFRDLRTRMRGERLEISRRRSTTDSVAQGGATLAIFATYAFLAVGTVRGAITVGGFVLYYQAFQRGQGWLRDALNNLANLYEGSLFLGDLFDFLDLEPAGTAQPDVSASEGAGRRTEGGPAEEAVVDVLAAGSVIRPESRAQSPEPDVTREPAIAFERVSYVYPGSTHKALDDVSFAIPAGQHVALAGENGSGKTTVVKLLCGLYRPTEGRILVDGVDLCEWDPAALRKRITVMFQDYARYQLTARENIGFGDLDALADAPRIRAAARQAGADTVVEALPHGYETRLGKWFEEGVELSTGDWQRVALARAFLRDAAIVVLDEPTSSLDAKVEHEVFGRLRQLARDRTAIFISHRMSTARLADCIYVLANGRVVESGTHDQLDARGGAYSTLFRLQAESYR